LGDQSLYKARLYSLLKSLQRKDVHSFFAEPVDPEYAPGYLEVIKKPMDFSTMAQKISSDEYKDIQQFQSDFELMCQNAMLYNKKDTIFYKWGKKLLKVGGRIISRETLSAPPATLPYTQQEEPFHKYKNNKRKKISLKEEFKSEIDLRLALVIPVSLILLWVLIPLNFSRRHPKRPRNGLLEPTPRAFVKSPS
jgi:hypothetical protein